MPAALRRTILVLLAVAAAVLLSGLPAFARAGSPVDDEVDFLRRMNAERASAGLPGFASASDLTTVARRQAQRMADANQHFHNKNLANELTGWLMLGENVGQGPTVASLHQAFMDSPPHRENVLRPEFSQVGVGEVRGADGQLFVVMVFRKPGSPAPQPAPAPAPAPAPSPPPPPPPPPTTAPPPPPTTVPPAPTTTTTVAPTPTVAPVRTVDTLGAVSAVRPVVASVTPVATNDSATAVAAAAAFALIIAVLAMHVGVLRRAQLGR